MAMKTPEATIDFLLTAIDSADGKVDWDAVAKKTGWYKGAKFSKQAYSNIHKKYAGTVIGPRPSTENGKTAPKKTPSKKTLKTSDEDDEEAADSDKKDTPKKSPKKRTASSIKGGKNKKANTESYGDEGRDGADGSEDAGDDEAKAGEE